MEKKAVMFNGKPMSFWRIVFFFVGLYVMALGIGFAVDSDWGVSPVTTLPYVVSRIFGITIGKGTILAFIAFICVQLIIYRKSFKLLYLLQFPLAILFGYFTDSAKAVVAFFIETPDFILFKLIMCLIGVALVALGVFIYLQADILSIPSDGVPVAMAWATKRPLNKMKRIFDITCVCISLVLSLVFMHDIEGLWIGTVVAAFGVGTVMPYWSKLLLKPLQRIMYGKKEEEPAAEAALNAEGQA